MSYNGVVTLNLTSATGKLVAMPNVTGNTYEEAYATLTNQGLKMTYDESLKSKIVDSQVPLQGVKLDPGTTVIIGVKK